MSKNESLNGVNISIIDNGCGMNEEDLKSIFVPYQTSKTTSTNVGLGLSIVYKIIQDHKGLIKINSTLGEGTTVSVWFQMGDEVSSNEKIDESMFVLANEFFE